MAYSDEPYTEQVVLLEGQGIWYYKPEDPHVTLAKAKFNMPLWPDKNFTRSEFGLQDDWFIFFLPQSVFKIHPLYDIVLLKIAMGVPNGHILVTGGRRTRWTDVYFHRLSKVFALSNVRDRIHVIPRVSSEKFLALLNISDVILHPFPFDGSRTSADAIIAGKYIDCDVCGRHFDSD
jgi:predicted O-linked N-acetylglucosamine transferase (SPINDLY family)